MHAYTSLSDRLCGIAVMRSIVRFLVPSRTTHHSIEPSLPGHDALPLEPPANPYIVEPAELLAWCQEGWTVSVDGTFRTNYFVYEVSDRSYVAGYRMSVQDGEPCITLSHDRFHSLEAAIREACHMACAEHCELLHTAA